MDQQTHLSVGFLCRLDVQLATRSITCGLLCRYGGELPPVGGDLGLALRDGRVILALLHSLYPAEVRCRDSADSWACSFLLLLFCVRRPAHATAVMQVPHPSAATNEGTAEDGGSLGLARTDDEDEWEARWRCAVSLANHVFGVPRLVDVSVRGFWANEVSWAPAAAIPCLCAWRLRLLPSPHCAPRWWW